MIDSIDIENFRCFKSIRIDNCKRINLIVGDNGIGKTSILEAIFFALGGSPELGLRFRQQRGIDAGFSGTATAIEKSLFGDLFYQGDLNKSISIQLHGDDINTRGVRVIRGYDPVPVPVASGDETNIIYVSNPDAPVNLRFIWTPASGRPREVQAQVNASSGIVLGNTGEDLESSFYFSATQNVSSTENASRFSILSKAKRERKFVDLFKKTFPYIENMSVEVSGATPAIHASIKGVSEKLPIANISGAVNRLVGVMLAFASRPRGVVVVDELENGVYYRHHQLMWQSILEFVRDFDCQLFTTSHSLEWIRAMICAAGKNVDDIAVWRIERSKTGKPILYQFSGREVRLAFDLDTEIRGGAKD